MGSDNVLEEQKKKYIPQLELDKESNKMLKDIFNNYRTGRFINPNRFNDLTNNLIDKDSRDIIFKFCCCNYIIMILYIFIHY